MSDSTTDRDAFFASYSGRVYIIHFEQKLHHAQHYVGSSTDLAGRLAQHRAGRGARLMEVITEQGIPWVVSRVLVGGKTLERRIKNQHHTARLCPVCRGELSIEDCRIPAPSPRTPGRRCPMGPERPVQFQRGGGA